jgi:diguanylate cyclase (GGDEF)-like protein
MTERPILPRASPAHPLLVLLAILVLPLVALFDYLGGPEFGFSLFYLIPIFLVARLGDWTSAWLTAMLAAFAWMVIDVLTSGYTTVLAPLWNTLTRFAFFSLALVALRNYQERLTAAQLRALSDPLTGLPNRQYLHIMLGAARARLERHGKPLTLAYLDIDDFKLLNDRHGHNAGDALLKQVARALAEHTRDTDTVARVGGDEFLILLPESPHRVARPVLERVHQALKEIPLPRETALTMSIGACTFHRPQESIEEMMRLADDVMYRVKGTGKNDLRIEDVP